MHEPGDVTKPRLQAADAWDYVEFWPAGVAATGRFACTACGNVVLVKQVLPRCLMCGERLWERAQAS